MTKIADSGADLATAAAWGPGVPGRPSRARPRPGPCNLVSSPKSAQEAPILTKIPAFGVFQVEVPNDPCSRLRAALARSLVSKMRNAPSRHPQRRVWRGAGRGQAADMGKQGERRGAWPGATPVMLTPGGGQGMSLKRTGPAQSLHRHRWGHDDSRALVKVLLVWTERGSDSVMHEAVGASPDLGRRPTVTLSVGQIPNGCAEPRLGLRNQLRPVLSPASLPGGRRKLTLVPWALKSLNSWPGTESDAAIHVVELPSGCFKPGARNVAGWRPSSRRTATPSVLLVQTASDKPDGQMPRHGAGAPSSEQWPASAPARPI